MSLAFWKPLQCHCGRRIGSGQMGGWWQRPVLWGVPAVFAFTGDRSRCRQACTLSPGEAFRGGEIVPASSPSDSRVVMAAHGWDPGLRARTHTHTCAHTWQCSPQTRGGSVRGRETAGVAQLWSDPMATLWAPTSLTCLSLSGVQCHPDCGDAEGTWHRPVPRPSVSVLVWPLGGPLCIFLAEKQPKAGPVDGATRPATRL